MAALSEIPHPRLTDLRHLRATDLDALLNEEVTSWERRLHWDFGPSVELVRRFVEMQALSGFALTQGNHVIGYVYYVCEERKGLLGDLYVIDSYRTNEAENMLLGAALDALFMVPGVHRVESQLMMIGQPLSRTLPLPDHVAVFARNFMEIELSGVRRLPERPTPLFRIEPWADADQDEAARVIAAAYNGHIDSRINDQYRSPAGARRFLLNIVQYPGCGSFFQPASYVAVDRARRQILGVCLSSIVSPGVGHITQICVVPELRTSGAGYALMRLALQSLAAHDCTRTSLTVTAANTSAVDLYRRIGFTTTRNFAAYVWENR